jgi:hypothetical protein
LSGHDKTPAAASTCRRGGIPINAEYGGAVPQVDVIDENFLVAEPARVAALLRDPARCRAWWPDLRLSIFADRGEQGVRWNITGALVGSMEVWLEAYGDGVIAHYYLRADPATGPYRSPHAARKEIHRRQKAAKAVFWRLKDELETNRAPGEPRCTELPAG